MSLSHNEGQEISVESEVKSSGPIRIYTEASSQRANEIRSGIYDATTPVRHHPNRWYAETVLDHYQPETLKEKGITRRQPIFTSPIPYQGHNPIPHTELLSLEVDASCAFVAEGEHLSEIINGPSFSRVMTLKKMVGTPEGGMTRTEFDEKFSAVSEQDRMALISVSEDLAKQYWESVIPYDEYVSIETPYYEPEILLLPDTPITVVAENPGKP